MDFDSSNKNISAPGKAPMTSLGQHEGTNDATPGGAPAHKGPLVVGSDCSGICTESHALDALGIAHTTGAP